MVYVAHHPFKGPFQWIFSGLVFKLEFETRPDVIACFLGQLGDLVT